MTAGAAVLVTALLLLVPGRAGAAPPQVVRPGGPVHVSVGGFAPNARVTIALQHTRSSRIVRADRHGRVVRVLVAPFRAGRYRLLVVGAVATGRRPAPPRAHGPGDHQVVAVTVPRLVTVDFVVHVPFRHGGGAGVDPVGASSSPPPPRAGGHGPSSSPAVTGTDVVLMVTVAAVLLIVGAALTRTSRRRAG